MVRKLPIEKTLEIMRLPAQVRNMCVIAHVDHGKSTLSDSLVAAAGIISVDQAGNARLLDSRDDEQARCITIKSTAISMYYHVDAKVLPDLDDKERDFLVNLIDSPGHVDFSSEVTAALRVTDGALVVVDCAEGVCVQTEVVLRQALAERIRPVLMVNKLDRAITQLKLNGEDAYQTFLNTIQSVNVVVATYNDPVMGDLQVYPEQGTVAFGSGKACWAFTITDFARRYASMFNVDVEKMVSRLWGDHFFDSETKKWCTEGTKEGRKLRRAFDDLIWDPIVQMFDAVMEQKSEKLAKMLSKLQLKLSEEEGKREGNDLLKAIMQKWLPASDALLQMIVLHLPSPVKAQSYRSENLYTGPIDDEFGTSIRNCDANGPLVVYISKLVPAVKDTRFIAFGRVFSGTVRSGQKVRIMGPNYEMGGKSDISVKNIQRTVIMMGKYQEAVDEIPCGNLVGLVGVDQTIVKTATITCESATECHPIRDMKYSVAPVVRVAVQPALVADTGKLVEGLKRLAKGDSIVQCTTSESGEHIVAAAGELHLEICLKDLRELYMQGSEITVSEPVVSYRETVTQESSQICLSKSPNKHNRIYGRAIGLGEEFSVDIENQKITPRDDVNTRARYLSAQHNWDVSEAKKIWCFGPETNGSNVVVDCTKGLSNLSEVKDMFSAAWQIASSEGVLCEENLRGVRYNLVDLMMHSDRAHRSGGQMIPTARRNYYASQLTAAPRLMEPIFMVEVQTVEQALGGIYSVLSKRRGIVVGEENRPGTPIYNVKAYVPVASSFGLTGDLRANTGGQAFPQCVFDHWEILNGDPLDKASAAGMVVNATRIRKGLKADVPSLDDLIDKL